MNPPRAKNTNMFSIVAIVPQAELIQVCSTELVQLKSPYFLYSFCHIQNHAFCRKYYSALSSSRHTLNFATVPFSHYKLSLDFTLWYLFPGTQRLYRSLLYYNIIDIAWSKEQYEIVSFSRSKNLNSRIPEISISNSEHWPQS